MSEATLREFLDRLNDDASYHESVQADPESAFAELGLSRTERAALVEGDEDALRRLAGMDVSGHYFSTTIITRYASQEIKCRPTNTPGSGNDCGTGQMCGGDLRFNG